MNSGDVLDRFDATDLTDKCALQDIQRKENKSMDGAVKFVIETDEIK
ncbi:MAG: hypothetical protein V8S14_00075 [Lachnospiraceae bacterium]